MFQLNGGPDDGAYQGDQVGVCEWNDDCADVLVVLLPSTTSFMDVEVIGLNEDVPGLVLEDLLDLLFAANYLHASVLHRFAIFYEQHQVKTLYQPVKCFFPSTLSDQDIETCSWL